MKSKNFKRSIFLCDQIVILDGLTGTGKTMFTPFISSFDRFQNARFEYMIEYLCIASKVNKISKDASNSLLNLLADVKYYDGAISREVNFRPSDLSSVFNSSKTMKYLRQLFMKDGEAVEKKIKIEKPILFLTTHQLLSCINPAIEAFGSRLKIIEMVRHPIYLIDHWESYISMHGKSVRDFTMWIDYNGESLPWFASGWEEIYIKSSSYDKVIYSIQYLMKVVFSYAKSEKYNHSIIFIPFEKFVLNPSEYTNHLENFLDTKMTKSSLRILEKENTPRKSINDSPQKSIYKRYALKAYDKKLSDKEDYNSRVKSAKEKCSPEAYKCLQDLSKEYENIFGLWF